MSLYEPTIPASLISMAEITARGISKSHVYQLIRQGRFPQPTLRIGTRFTRWSAESINEWFADPAAWMKVRGSEA